MQGKTDREREGLVLFREGLVLFRPGKICPRRNSRSLDKDNNRTRHTYKEISTRHASRPAG